MIKYLLDVFLTTDENFSYSKEPKFLVKPKSTNAHEGDTVVIICEVIGDPKPEVLWLRDFLKVRTKLTLDKRTSWSSHYKIASIFLPSRLLTVYQIRT